MKIKYRQKKHGDIKIIRKFLLFPRIHNGEIRWLEIATLKYEYLYDYAHFDGEWMLRGFID